MQKNDLIPFAKMHPSMAKLPTWKDAATAFAEVFFAAEYLHKEHGMRSLRAIVEAMGTGATDQQAVEKATGKPFGAFEKGWMAYLRTQPPPASRAPVTAERPVLKGKNTPPEEGKKGREISFGDFDDVENPAARRWAHLGELFRERGRFVAAAEEYGKAHALVGNAYETISNKYALALMAVKRLDEAEKVLLASLEAHPGYASTQVHLGRIYLSRGQWAEARTAYRAALAQDPFDPGDSPRAPQVGAVARGRATGSTAREAPRPSSPALPVERLPELLVAAARAPVRPVRRRAPPRPGRASPPTPTGAQEGPPRRPNRRPANGYDLSHDLDPPDRRGARRRPACGGGARPGTVGHRRSRSRSGWSGQREVVEHLLIALFSRGHCLFVGVPGLAKTLLISTLAEVLNLTFNRIQFTPDLMPSDITGTDILEEDRATGHREFRFVRGPLFANIILADEINRTPPKTQAALLQAMQEYRVTAGGETYPAGPALPRLRHPEPHRAGGDLSRCPRRSSTASCSWWTWATRAPRRRSRSSRAPPRGPSPRLTKVLSPEQILALQELVRRVPVPDHVVRYAVELVRQTRPKEPGAPELVRKHVNWGAGPRASQYLVVAAKARAVLQGRFAATVEDVRALALPVLRHRVLPNFAAESEGITSTRIVQQLLELVKG